MKWFSRSKKSNEWAENPTPVRRVGGVRIGGTNGVITIGMGGEAGTAAEGERALEYGTLDVSGGHEHPLSMGHRTEAERDSRPKIPIMSYESGRSE